MLCRVLGPGLVIFREFAAAPEIAGRRKPLARCLGPEGLPLDRCVTLDYGSGINRARKKNRPGFGGLTDPLNRVSPVVPFFPTSCVEGGSAGSGELI